MIISLLFIGFSIWFFINRNSYQDYLHESFIIIWTGYAMVLINGWYAVNLIWLFPLVAYISEKFYQSNLYHKYPDRLKYAGLITNAVLISFILSI